MVLRTERRRVGRMQTQMRREWRSCGVDTLIDIDAFIDVNEHDVISCVVICCGVLPTQKLRLQVGVERGAGI
jgi:hypothetical protein